MKPGLVDAHAHLEAMQDVNVVLLRAKEAGIGTVISCGSSVQWSKKAIAIAEGNSGNLVDIFACVGIHPEDGREELAKSKGDYLDQLRELAKSKKVVALGECGLDYGQTTDNLQLTTDEKKFQADLFRNQIKLASDLKLPLVVHCRNAWADVLDILSDVSSQMSVVPGMFHSWTGTLADAKRVIDLGFYISFSGIVTFKNAGEIVEVAKWVPKDRMLVETDSPYLSPMPLRGKTNEPKNVRITAQFLADLRGEPPDTIREVTTRNAKQLFSL